MVEFDVPESSKLETLTDTVVAALKKYVPSDYKYAVSRKKAAGEVQVMCADPYQVIKSAKIQKVVESGCYEGCSDCEYVDTDVAVNITKNVAPFATGEWLTENLRFPTYPNLRYASVMMMRNQFVELPMYNILLTTFLLVRVYLDKVLLDKHLLLLLIMSSMCWTL